MSVPAPMPLSTANWHWKNKNVTSWGRTWFERQLSEVEAKEGDDTVAIVDVTEFEGDVELGQRKSKLITIYDCSISLKWEGTASDGTKVNGKLKIPEVSHEVTLDGLSDYAYEWSLSSEASPTASKLFALAKKLLPPALEVKFSAFPLALVDTHGKDLQVAGSTEPSRSGTPAQNSTSAAAVTSSATAQSSGPKVVRQEKKPLSTATVKVEANFMASADDLFGMLTDKNRIPQWTRAPAESDPVPNGAYSLFGGGVKGTYVSLDKPTKIVQKWALASPTWPSEHYATLETTLEQSTDSTKLTLSLNGVPTGMEDEIKRNLEGYYIHGFKSIGYVHLVYSEPNTSRTTSRRDIKSRDEDEKMVDSNSSTRVIAIVLALVVLAGAFAVPLIQKKQS